jgi:hypothetical protein
MEPWMSFTNSQFNHHSFLRWAKGGSKSKKEEKAAERVFDAMAIDDAMDKSLMLTAFSA